MHKILTIQKFRGSPRFLDKFSLIALIPLMVLVMFAFGSNIASAAQGPWVLPSAPVVPQGFAAAAGGDVVVAPDGTTTAVWAEETNSVSVIKVSTRAPHGSFGLPVSLSGDKNYSGNASIAVAPDGTTAVAWVKNFAASTFVVQASVRPPNGTFGPADEISQVVSTATYPIVAFDSQNNLTVVWRHSVPNAGAFIEVIDKPKGQPFGASVAISNIADSVTEVDLAISPAGSPSADTATVVWRSIKGIEAVTRPPGGVFTSSAQASLLSAAGANRPSIEAAPNGSVTVAWHRNATGGVLAEATTRPSGGSFSAPVDLSGPGLGFGLVWDIGVDSSSRVTVIWQGENGLFASTKTAAGNFPPFGQATTLTTGQEIPGSASLAVAPDGTATVVWVSGIPGALPGDDPVGSRTKALTRQPTGQFPSPGQAANLSEDKGVPTFPRVAIGKDGRATAVWVDDIGAPLQFASTQASEFILAVKKQGAGQGHVGSSPQGIDCGQVCEGIFNTGSVVQLTAKENTGSTFAGWDGPCELIEQVGQNSVCSVTIDRYREVAAIFNLVGVDTQFSLTTNIGGPGGGTVSSDPVGIADCAGECTTTFGTGLAVTLTAKPGNGSVFSGWGGTCWASGNSPTCVITMDRARQATANFNVNGAAPQYSLTIEKSGQGFGIGKVKSSPAGIDCGSVCDTTFGDGQVVVLTAEPASGSTFGGWGGSCASQMSNPTCTVTMDRARQASFTMNLVGSTPFFPLSVEKRGLGQGKVGSTPQGISCGDDCEEGFTAGTKVLLVAEASAGSVFAGWDGVCAPAGKSLSCEVTMSEARFAIASFDVDKTIPLSTRLLTVALVGQGSGTVTSSPAGISCGIDCEEPYAKDTSVTLTAVPAKGSMFIGWSGACAAAAAAVTCQVTMDEARSVTANFTLEPTATTAVFDGKFIYIRLKCGAKYKPGCKGYAQAMTKKPKKKVKKHGKVKRVKKPKAMTSRGSAAQKAKKWKIVKLQVKPAYIGKIATMAKQPTKKSLNVKLVVSAKKYKRNKKTTVYHRYRVRTAL